MSVTTSRGWIALSFVTLLLFPGSRIAAAGDGRVHVVRFSGPEVPHSLQVELSHAPSADAVRVTSAGDAPLALAWSDVGRALRVIVTPANGTTPAEIRAFDLFVDGVLVDVRVTDLRAYDVLGRPILDVAASVE